MGETKVLNNRQPTFKQKAVAKELILNAKRERPLNAGQILEKVGYSKNVAKVLPSKVFNSAGVQQALMEAGATPNSLAKVVDEAMKAKQGQWFHGEYKEHDAPDHRVRLNAANLLGDLVGAKKMIVQNQNVNVDLTGKQLIDALGL